MMDGLVSVELLLQRVTVLERQAQRHRRLAGLLLIAVSVVATMGLQAPVPRTRFAEIDVERINVIEPDGQLALSIANSARLPQPLLGGKTLETARRGPGMIFFDGKGWEVGGLIYGTEQADGVGSGYAHLSFDQYHGDQVLYLHHEGNGKRKSSGLHVVDRGPEMGTKGIERVFVGSLNETAMVRVRDLAGRDRIRMMVDPAGAARLEILDAAGQVVAKLPQ
jgi:hypothetical protein